MSSSSSIHPDRRKPLNIWRISRDILLNIFLISLQRFGMERVAKVESLQEIIDEMGDNTTAQST
jgi:hypothetical protein